MQLVIVSDIQTIVSTMKRSISKDYRWTFTEDMKAVVNALIANTTLKALTAINVKTNFIVLTENTGMKLMFADVRKSKYSLNL